MDKVNTKCSALRLRQRPTKKKRLVGNPSLLETRKVILRMEMDARQITIVSAVHPDNKTTPNAKHTGQFPFKPLKTFLLSWLEDAKKNSFSAYFRSFMQELKHVLMM